MRTPSIVLLGLVLSAALAGCSGGAGPREPDWTEVQVPAGHMLDLEYTLGSGTTLSWEWSVEQGTPTAFQVLYVTGSSTYPMESEYSDAGQGERTTPQSGRYDLTWDNQRDTELTVRFVVLDGYSQKVWPAGQGPGCAPVLLGAASLC